MARPTKYLAKEDILRAQKMTLSNRAAARYLHVSYVHYKKYAKTYTDAETGKSLLELHKNQAGKGIPKYLRGTGEDAPLLDLIEGRVPAEHFNPRKIKERLLASNLIDECCGMCGFKERRLIDNKIPLILNHKDKNNQNFLLDNLEFLCYNCAFLYAESPISDQEIEKMEDYIDTHGEQFDWEMDDATIEHLKSLGLYKEEKRPGEEFISRQ